ncbi:NUDIX hydrolase [Paenibacillus sp. KS1]|uniref:NUDIX domain-containing protein n=1 Tax=Paenibacillus sp. KS1 TaxID=1849249 RepID=UPI0008065DCA|nr:NUDIX hydrolase [Paenibacillus sp. KS1]
MQCEMQQKYHVLARGIMLSGEYLLVAHCIGMDNTFLPGGHVEFREGMQESLSREIFEEMGLQCEVKQYIGAVEAGYEDNNVYHQEINHLFIADAQGIDHSRNPESKEQHLEFYWIHVNEMDKHNLLPYPVREAITHCKSGNRTPFWGSDIASSGES